MTKPFLGIPRLILGFILVIVVPIMAVEALLYQTITERAIEVENACRTRVVVQEPVATPSPTPTATPSPTLKPRFVPAVTIVPSGAK